METTAIIWTPQHLNLNAADFNLLNDRKLEAFINTYYGVFFTVWLRRDLVFFHLAVSPSITQVLTLRQLQKAKLRGST